MKTRIRMLTVALLVAATVLSAHGAWAMTGREFVGLFWSREKLAEVDRYRSFFKEQGYRYVPDAYSLAAHMELNIRSREQYDLWLDHLTLMAAKELGMRR
jgi:hypothetical protein